MTAEDYYQQYLNRDIFEVFDITCEFFSKELSKDVIDNYDVGEVILETVGHHIDDKKFPQVFQFVELLREKQPSLYQEYFQYMDDFLVDYNCFIGDKNGVVNAFQNFIENPVHEFDQFLQAFKMLRFYQYSGLVEQAVSQSYEEVRDAEDLMGNAAQYLAICQFYIALEERFDRKSGFIDIDSFLSSLSEYDFDFDYSFLNSIGNGLRKDSLDAEALEKLFERNYRGALMEIEGCFLRFMSEKGFKFFLSGFFWDEMLKYWYRDDVSGQTLTTLFDLDGSSFEEFIVGYHSWIFGDNKHEMAAVLWGSVYVYEFLFRNGLISKEAFDDFFVIASRLKGKMIGLFVSGLWRFDFVHTWEKPECISEVEFEAERSIFRKSYSFPVGDFASIKEEMAEDFLLLPDLGSYILEGIDLGANEQNSAGDFLFKENDLVHDFFSPREPLRVEKTPGRNDPCLCGSGKKYKKCCGK